MDSPVSDIDLPVDPSAVDLGENETGIWFCLRWDTYFVDHIGDGTRYSTSVCSAYGIVGGPGESEGVWAMLDLAVVVFGDCSCDLGGIEPASSVYRVGIRAW